MAPHYLGSVHLWNPITVTKQSLKAISCSFILFFLFGWLWNIVVGNSLILFVKIAQISLESLTTIRGKLQFSQPEWVNWQFLWSARIKVDLMNSRKCCFMINCCFISTFPHSCENNYISNHLHHIMVLHCHNVTVSHIYMYSCFYNTGLAGY